MFMLSAQDCVRAETIIREFNIDSMNLSSEKQHTRATFHTKQSLFTIKLFTRIEKNSYV